MSIEVQAKELAEIILTNGNGITTDMRQKALLLYKKCLEFEGPSSVWNLEDGTSVEISASHMNQYRELIPMKKKIEVIKLLREHYALSLKNAKYLADDIFCYAK
jgi:hypothetical protein